MTRTPGLDLLIATSNRGKVKEIKLALDDLPLKLRLLKDFPDISVPDETGASYEENARIKAEEYANQTGLCALADDSGLEVSALDGAPGINSALFGGNELSDAERTSYLLSRLAIVATEERMARFVCVMAIAEPARGVMNIAKGICEGRIAKQPAGDGGFGFDPVFIPIGYRMTFAQMSLQTKNRISHRTKALAETRKFLKYLIG